MLYNCAQNALTVTITPFPRPHHINKRKESRLGASDDPLALYAWNRDC